MSKHYRRVLVAKKRDQEYNDNYTQLLDPAASIESRLEACQHLTVIMQQTECEGDRRPVLRKHLVELWYCINHAKMSQGDRARMLSKAVLPGCVVDPDDLAFYAFWIKSHYAEANLDSEGEEELNLLVKALRRLTGNLPKDNPYCRDAWEILGYSLD
jgi:hypothetical protein